MEIILKIKTCALSSVRHKHTHMNINFCSLNYGIGGVSEELVWVEITSSD